ncbi:hypothetical protein BAU15_10915 [Enterococcus sp. JM4C]|uniref:RNA polymerase sigma factor n=1 Tax=Candidatus Enterococcus huntleyi TaxID=1857217 RepID=UPI00137A952C|nr:sigma-70 family RNA polymerase sigma factor [Enterococcus sp. JM4C]KAF1298629.1 hypothetical protein BAU15_10915 [Enterococcus sp. JM4C]
MEKESPDSLFFEQLYLDYEQKIFHLAYSIINNNEQAEDITQDVFEQLYQQITVLKTYDTVRLKKFILRTTKNKAIDSYRKNRVVLNYKEAQQSSPEETVTAEAEPLRHLYSKELIAKISAGLNEPYLHVFLYRIYYGFSGKETADLMGVKPDTVKKQLERAKKKIKHLVEGEQTDE